MIQHKVMAIISYEESSPTFTRVIEDIKEALDQAMEKSNILLELTEDQMGALLLHIPISVNVDAYPMVEFAGIRVIQRS